jgi:hypothetical protein
MQGLVIGLEGCLKGARRGSVGICGAMNKGAGLRVRPLRIFPADQQGDRPHRRPRPNIDQRLAASWPR